MRQGKRAGESHWISKACGLPTASDDNRPGVSAAIARRLKRAWN